MAEPSAVHMAETGKTRDLAVENAAVKHVCGGRRENVSAE